ncbi:MAG TPA: hypothetical protein VMU83_23420 [Hanamia sp.]|nr:hypothetical protein [Hanamia sp.]
MIVPTMNPEEIYRELIRDFDSVKRRGLGSGDIFRREMLRKKLQHENAQLLSKQINLMNGRLFSAFGLKR